MLVGGQEARREELEEPLARQPVVRERELRLRLAHVRDAVRRIPQRQSARSLPIRRATSSPFVLSPQSRRWALPGAARLSNRPELAELRAHFARSSSARESFADWFRQLWAESLGKQNGLKRKNVYAGQTPVKALGTTDQHSQVQLYREGPNNKVITFLEVKRFSQKLSIPSSMKGVATLDYLPERIFRP